MLMISCFQLVIGVLAWTQLRQASLPGKFINWVFFFLFICGALLWGSLSGLLETGVSADSEDGVWLFFMVVIMVMAIFRGGLFYQLLWLVMAAIPFVVMNLSNDGFLEGSRLVISLGFVFVAILFMILPHRKHVESIEDESLEKLQKDYEQLQIAFNAQDSAIAAETTLRQAVEESLRHANRIAEVASRSKTEFMATIGHEIRTPLNGIIPILEMLAGTGLNQEQMNLVKTASNSSFHLLGIINDILDYSKAEVGKLEIENIELDLQGVVHSVTDLMRQSAEEKGLFLNVVFAPDVPRRVRGDTLRLKQIITNLLSNALKFTEEGGVSVEISLRQESAREVELLFTVRDTGIGMSELITRKLFQSFTQADASTTRNYGGTGLGLAICKRLVELMGGEIGVKSTQGKGSIFWFFLPMRKSLKDVPARREKVEDARILYFLKNSRKKDIYEMIQADYKVHVELSQDLNDILQKLKQAERPQENNAFDLLIIDVVGSELTAVNDVQIIGRAIKNSPTQIIAINALPSIARELRDRGANSVLQRPFNAEMFRQNLFRLLDIGLDSQTVESTNENGMLENLMNLSSASIQLKEQDQNPENTYDAKVLLVEDNPINREVARKMLIFYGLDVDVAEDGYQALQAMKLRSYDLVFMDCQMPRMDGFEATRLWRNHEQEQDHGLSTKHRMVIIAITANAMRGDREKCIAAKMDDYLPKPLTRSFLNQMLQKWLSEKVSGKVSVQNTHPADNTTDKKMDELLDLSVIDELKQVMGDDYKNVIHSYLQHSSQLFTRMKHMASEGNAEEVRRSVHSFKSSSKNVGAIKLGDRALALEQQLRNKQEVDLNHSVQRLLVDYDQVAKALEKVL
ncbi:MAG: response regulator [Gammaproteobacteria bacterium]|nr:response regulator [Gammaproteobacteria bacterium]